MWNMKLLQKGASDNRRSLFTEHPLLVQQIILWVLWTSINRLGIVFRNNLILLYILYIKVLLGVINTQVWYSSNEYMILWSNLRKIVTAVSLHIILYPNQNLSMDGDFGMEPTEKKTNSKSLVIKFDWRSKANQWLHNIHMCCFIITFKSYFARNWRLWLIL